MFRSVLCVIVVALLATAMPSAQLGRITEKQARRAADAAAKQAKADPEKFQSLYLKRIRALVPEFSETGLTVWSDSGFGVYLIGPTSLVGHNRYEAIRAKKTVPPAEDQWKNSVSVNLRVKRLDSLDIVKIILTRDGAVVASIGGSLQAKEKTSLIGVRTTRHEGILEYPIAAFDRGAEVVFTLVPRTGASIVRMLSEKELRSIQ